MEQVYEFSTLALGRTSDHQNLVPSSNIPIDRQLPDGD